MALSVRQFADIQPTDRAHAHRGVTARGVTAVVLAMTFLVVLLDAMLQPLAPFDLPLMRVIQAPDGAVVVPVLNTVKELTGSEGAIAAWVVTGLVFLARRWWAAAATLALMPLGGVINEGIGILLVERERPHDPSLFRASLNFEERSFPSGHVTGAVLLYGLIFVVAGRVRWAPLRWAIRTGAVLVVAMTAYQRMWGGAHWPTDVLAALALGGLLLVGLVAVLRWLEPELDGRPFAGAVGRAVVLAVALPAVAWQRVAPVGVPAHRPARPAVRRPSPAVPRSAADRALARRALATRRTSTGRPADD